MANVLLSESVLEKTASLVVGGCIAGGLLAVSATAAPVVAAGASLAAVLGAVGLRAVIKETPDYEKAWKAVRKQLPRNFVRAQDAETAAVDEAARRLSEALDGTGLFTVEALENAVRRSAKVTDGLTAYALEAVSLRDPIFAEAGLPRDLAEDLFAHGFQAALETSSKFREAASLAVGEETLSTVREMKQSTDRTADELTTLRQLFEDRLANTGVAQAAGLNEAQVRNLLDAFALKAVPLSEAEALLLKAAEELRSLRSQLVRLTNQDPETNRLKQEAALAIDEGRLDEAKALVLAAAERHRLAGDELSEALRLHRLAEAETLSEAARLDRLQARYEDAAELYGQAASVAAAFDGDIAWQYRFSQADVLADHGRLFSGASSNAAVQIWRICLEHTPVESRPSDWAFTQSKIGGALAILGERTSGESGVKYLKESLLAFYATDQVYDEILSPGHWAMNRNNVGMSLSLLGRRSKGSMSTLYLQEAVEACRAAAGADRAHSSLSDWIGFQSNLGLSLQYLGERMDGPDGLKLLSEANEVYRRALAVTPKLYKDKNVNNIQNNLGLNLYTLGTSSPGDSGAKMLQESVAAFREALEYHSKFESPVDWATTQSNLGLALLNLARRLGRAEAGPMLEEAAEVLGAAISTLSETTTPIPWAMAQNNIGMVYSSLAQFVGDNEAGEQYLQKSLEATTSALRIYSPEHEPASWAQCQLNLSATEATIAKRRRDPAALESAIAKTEAVVEAFRVLGAGSWVSLAQGNIDRMNTMLSEIRASSH